LVAYYLVYVETETVGMPKTRNMSKERKKCFSLKHSENILAAIDHFHLFLYILEQPILSPFSLQKFFFNLINLCFY